MLNTTMQLDSIVLQIMSLAPCMLAIVAEAAEACWPLQVLFLALRMQLDGIVPQIMSLPPHMLEEKPSDPVTGKSWSYPPTYFMHMALDHATAQRVSADIAVIKSKQVGCMQNPTDFGTGPIRHVHSVQCSSSEMFTRQRSVASAPFCHLETLNTDVSNLVRGSTSTYHPGRWYVLTKQ